MGNNLLMDGYKTAKTFLSPRDEDTPTQNPYHLKKVRRIKKMQAIYDRHNERNSDDLQFSNQSNK